MGTGRPNYVVRSFAISVKENTANILAEVLEVYEKHQMPSPFKMF